MYQEQYWHEMVGLRAHQTYLTLYQLSSERWDLGFKIFLALMSSGAIGAWAVWQDYSKLWASLVALSQVISAVSQFMPFKARIKAMGPACAKMAVLADRAERDWFKVSEGELTNREINKARHDLKELKRKIMSDSFGNMVLPIRKRRMENASQQTTEYFSAHYGV